MQKDIIGLHVIHVTLFWSQAFKGMGFSILNDTTIPIPYLLEGYIWE